MKKTLVGALALAVTTQAFGFGIQIDTKKRASIKKSQASSYSEESDEHWEDAEDDGLSLRKYLPKLGSPVHESLTKEALRRAGLDHNTNWVDKNGDTIYGPDEVLTGLLFNDDPDGYLFPYNKFSNPKGFDTSINGIKWLKEFVKLEIFIHQRAKGLEKLPQLKKDHARLTEELKTLRPMSQAGWFHYDAVISRLNSVNSQLEKIKELEDRYNIGDLKEMAKIEESINSLKSMIAQAEANIKNPKPSKRGGVNITLGRGATAADKRAAEQKRVDSYIAAEKEKISRLNKELRKVEKKLQRYQRFSAIKNNIMYASHFGDLQYMHAMGSNGQTRDEVKAKIMGYAGHAWKTATAELSFKEQRKRILQEQRAAKDSKKPGDQFRNRFIITDLLYHTKDAIGIKYRALGSLIHMVQDSYAKGHTVRQKWEIKKGDPQGNYSNSGAIRFFQDYSGQGGGEESHADHDVNHDDKDDYMAIPGAQMATRRSEQLIKLFIKGCKWEPKNGEALDGCPPKGVKNFLDKVVFALVEEVEPGLMKGENGEKESSATRAHPKLAPAHNHNH